MIVVRRAVVAFVSAAFLVMAHAPAGATMMISCRQLAVVKAGDTCPRIYAKYFGGRAAAYAEANGGQSCREPLAAGRQICVRK